MAFPGLDRYFHSTLFSLSLLFIQCPRGSLSGLMFPPYLDPILQLETHTLLPKVCWCVFFVGIMIDLKAFFHSQ